MKCTLFSLLLLGGLAAANGEQGKPKPFTLFLLSGNKRLDGLFLNICHEGIGLDALCVEGEARPIFTHDTEGITPVLGYDRGFLRSHWPKAEPPSVSTMRIHTDISTNVALPLLHLDKANTTNGQHVVFDDDGRMGIITFINDFNKIPMENFVWTVRRWFICTTHHLGGYRYRSLTWVMGRSKPQNPSCAEVEVKRAFY